MSLGSCQEMNVSEMFSLARTPLIRSHPHTPVTHTRWSHPWSHPLMTTVPSSHPGDTL